MTPRATVSRQLLAWAGLLTLSCLIVPAAAVPTARQKNGPAQRPAPRPQSAVRKPPVQPVPAPPVEPAAPAIELFDAATFLLPAHAGVEVDWLLPPSAEQTSRFQWFAIAPEGDPVLAGSYSDNKWVASPRRGYVVNLNYDDDIKGLAYLDNSLQLLAIGSEIGWPAPAAKVARHEKTGLPLVAFQPWLQSPVRKISAFAAVGNSLLVAGSDPGVTGNALFLLRDLKGAGPKDWVRLFVSRQDITAITGDADNLYVALGRNLLKIARSDNAITPVYTHKAGKITGLAPSPAGLAVTDGNSLIVLGPKGPLEIMRSTEAMAIQARADRLYVYFPSRAAVLSLAGLADLARFDPPRPAAVVPGQAAIAIDRVRFNDIAQPNIYADTFARAGLKILTANVDFHRVGATAKPEDHIFTAKWFEPTGRLLQRQSIPLNPDPRVNSQVFPIGGDEGHGGLPGPGYQPNGASWWRFTDQFGNRYPGRYRLELSLDGRPLGEWGFTISGEASIDDIVMYNNLPEMQARIAGGLNLNQPDANGALPLNIAAQWGTPAMLELMLKSGANPNLKSGNGHVAIVDLPTYENWKPKTELLARYGADINQTVDGRHLIFSSWDEGRVLWFLQHGADINALDPIMKKSLLQMAGRASLMPDYCAEPLLTYLIQHGADMEAMDDTKRTMLGTALFNGKPQCVINLLAHEPSLSRVSLDYRGNAQSALYSALSGDGLLNYATPPRRSEIVRALLAKGAKLNLGEGSVIFSGTNYLYFDEATLLRVLEQDRGRVDPEMLKIDPHHTGESISSAEYQALQSKEPAVQELALRALPGWLRNMLNLPQQQNEYAFLSMCNNAFGIIEVRLKPQVIDIMPDDAKAGANSMLGAPLVQREKGGVYIGAFPQGSAAARTGLKVGDIILEIDGQSVTSPADVTRMMGQRMAGTPVSLTLLREDALAYPQLWLSCGIVERETSERARSNMHLSRWLETNGNAGQASNIRKMLSGR